MRRRRNDPFEKPWVIIAAVIGIIAVVGIALLLFMGNGSSAPAGSLDKTQSPSGIPSTRQTAGVPPSVIKTQTAVIVPEKGVYIKVSYLGGFAGTYGMEGNMTTTRNSGDRIFAVEDATGTVSATFHKEDASTRHDIILEIYKDGKSQQVAKNSSSYGEVSVTYRV